MISMFFCIHSKNYGKTEIYKGRLSGAEAEFPDLEVLTLSKPDFGSAQSPKLPYFFEWIPNLVSQI